MSALFRCALGTGLLLGLSGCALLGKSEALTPRYFSPDVALAGTHKSASARPDPAAPELRIGRITAATHLGERIVFRDSTYELNFYEQRRWTERPEAYLRRALARSLFEEHGLRRIVSGAGPTLEVELTEFAEVRGTQPLVRVRATYLLYGNRLVRREATVSVELPISASAKERESPETTVRVMADALNRTVQQIVEQVTTELRTPAPEERERAPEGSPGLVGTVAR